MSGRRSLVAGCRKREAGSRERRADLTVADLLLWIVVGGVAGILADFVVGGVRLGPGAVLVGILGAVVGSWLFRQFGIASVGGMAGSILIAFVGAVILLLILRAFRR